MNKTFKLLNKKLEFSYRGMRYEEFNTMWRDGYKIVASKQEPDAEAILSTAKW